MGPGLIQGIGPGSGTHVHDHGGVPSQGPFQGSVQGRQGPFVQLGNQGRISREVGKIPEIYPLGTKRAQEIDKGKKSSKSWSHS